MVVTREPKARITDCKCKHNKEKSNVGNKNVKINNFGKGVKKRVNIWKCYFKHEKCGWNNTHISGFHAECQRDSIAFCNTDDHAYWDLSGITPNKGTTGSSSRGGFTQGSLASQYISTISDFFQHYQGESYHSNFTSFLSDFSGTMDSLK